jgi:hypothetical protein
MSRKEETKNINFDSFSVGKDISKQEFIENEKWFTTHQ